MFKLFLRKKILSGENSGRTKGRAQQSAAKAAPPNRRGLDRFPIDHKHLTLMNEQDIFLVREISSKGFSTEVSPRGFARMTVGDIYEARARYFGRLYDLEARVAWKAAHFVGFEIVKADPTTFSFIRRLLRPIEIANSMRSVDATFMNEADSGKSWYHGDEESDLYLWHDVDSRELRAWQLTVGHEFVEWSTTHGLATGLLTGETGPASFMSAGIDGQTHRRDVRPDETKKQFAIDVIMALQASVREEILETFSD